MTDAEFIKRIVAMTESELLDVVMVSAEWLTDGYYSNLGNALRRRHAQLVIARAKP